MQGDFSFFFRSLTFLYKKHPGNRSFPGFVIMTGESGI